MTVCIRSQWKTEPDRCALRYSHVALDAEIRKLKRNARCISFRVYTVDEKTHEEKFMHSWSR